MILTMYQMMPIVDVYTLKKKKQINNIIDYKKIEKKGNIIKLYCTNKKQNKIFLTKKLIEHGYTIREVRKILGDNFKRIFKEVCK